MARREEETVFAETISENTITNLHYTSSVARLELLEVAARSLFNARLIRYYERTRKRLSVNLL